MIDGENDSDRESPVEQQQGDQNIRDRAFVLPLLGCFLLLPPLAGVFQLDLRIFGVPFTGLYLFFVWGLLIAGAAWLSGRLRNSAAWQGSQRKSTLRSETAER